MQESKVVGESAATEEGIFLFVIKNILFIPLREITVSFHRRTITNKINRNNHMKDKEEEKTADNLLVPGTMKVVERWLRHTAHTTSVY